VIERQAVRALLISPQEQLLLIKIIEPQSKRAFWLTPGGGVDPSESPTAGLKREIFEETGLTGFEIGPEVWHREHLFTWAGRSIRQREKFYLVKVPRFEPTPQHLPDEVERAAFDGFRWWGVTEIEHSQEEFAPGGLGQLLQALLRDGPPAQPIVLTR
jgi:8-oxo-dGTP pyrophosphatase MutT (NUDIX family)